MVVPRTETIYGYLCTVKHTNMTIKQVKDYFIDKKNVACPLTEKLVKAGYQQISGGYIDRAKRKGVLVDYKENSPSQYWHLMTYCDSRSSERPFSKSVICGELILWMAEVSGAVDKDSLERLVNHIVESADHTRGIRPIFNRIKWNREIYNLCFARIMHLKHKSVDFT